MSYALMVSRILNILRDIVFAYFYIGSIPARREMSAYKKAFSLCFLLFIFIMSSVDLIDIFTYTIVSFLFRGICVFLYIRSTKKISAMTSLYDAILIDTVCVVNHNIFLTPLTRPILNAQAVFVPDPLANRMLCILITNVFSILVYVLVYKFIPLKNVKNANPLQIGLLLLLSVVSIYLNSTLKLLTDIDPAQGLQLSIFAIMLQGSLLICIGFFESYKVALHRMQRAMLENEAALSLLESIEAHKKNDELLREVRHDLKNHTISLEHLIKSGKNDEALRYLTNLREEYMISKAYIQTGNDILDGILAQKLATAEKDDIVLSVAADFSFLKDIEGADLCIIFGNLLDNAVEGCKNVKDGLRYINIRGNVLGDMVIYTIENSCDPKLSFHGGLPSTTKKEIRRHGIGLHSVKRMVLKNGGELGLSAEGGKFSAVISFPMASK